MLERSPFSKVEVLRWETPAPALTLDEVVGLQFSYSFTAPALLGNVARRSRPTCGRGRWPLEPSGRYEFGDLVQELTTAVRP
jgi:hypothetical protein